MGPEIRDPNWVLNFRTQNFSGEAIKSVQCRAMEMRVRYHKELGLASEPKLASKTDLGL